MPHFQHGVDGFLLNNAVDLQASSSDEQLIH